MEAESQRDPTGDALDLVLGEGQGAHMKRDPHLRQAVEETQHLVDRLRADPDPELSHDLAPDILETLEREALPALLAGTLRPLMFKAAAVLVGLLGLGVVYTLIPRSPHPGSEGARDAFSSFTAQQALERGLDWLMAVQQEDGSWDPAAWGGIDRGQIGLTGLALTALVDGASAASSPGLDQASRRAGAYLSARQQADGRIGFPGRAPLYQHGLATLGLLHLYEQGRDETLRPVLDRALAFLASRGDESAGWGYGSTGDHSGRDWVWPSLALKKAATLGWQVPAATSLLPEIDARAAPEALQMYARHVRWAAPAGQAVAVPPEMGLYLISLQVQEGPSAGSWDPPHSPGRAGGRIYATALTALALRSALEGEG